MIPFIILVLIGSFMLFIYRVRDCIETAKAEKKGLEAAVNENRETLARVNEDGRFCIDVPDDGGDTNTFTLDAFPAKLTANLKDPKKGNTINSEKVG